MPSAPTIAFFGAGGGTSGYCLALCLNAGYDCVALARTPSKLTQSLRDKNVSADTIEKHLTTISGNVKDVEAVKQTIAPNGQPVSKIVSGIGASPNFQWSLFHPVTMDDPTVCQTAMKTILQALDEIKPVRKPSLVAVSTTGIPREGCPWDVPYLLTPLYSVLLHAPHQDKAVMQNDLIAYTRRTDAESWLNGFLFVKPPLLTNGPAVGIDKIREGVDNEPAVGYTLSREDVGIWIFERYVKTGIKAEWENKSVVVSG